jgi:hypothetical protein
MKVHEPPGDSRNSDHAAKIKRALEIQYGVLPESRPTPESTPEPSR